MLALPGHVLVDVTAADVEPPEEFRQAIVEVGARRGLAAIVLVELTGGNVWIAAEDVVGVATPAARPDAEIRLAVVELENRGSVLLTRRNPLRLDWATSIVWSACGECSSCP